ncbi:hypothetical protein B566_EDAN014053 [Ephemera danica]|nr:hypothetical protein B566_EDAN014053 [Ephemera danica]
MITTAEDVKIGRPMMNGSNQKNLADIGGRQAEEFWWTSGVRHNEGWLWTGSGSIMKYFDWDDNEPDPPAYPAQSCVWIKNGRLGDYPCDFENYFVCEEKPRC